MPDRAMAELIDRQIVLFLALGGGWGAAAGQFGPVFGARAIAQRQRRMALEL